jgi:hypothetical protein
MKTRDHYDKQSDHDLLVTLAVRTEHLERDRNIVVAFLGSAWLAIFGLLFRIRG